jgi:cytochrome c-type biogenesis protein CcmH/NrfG
MDICLAHNGAGNFVVTEVMKEAINHYSSLQNADYMIQLLNQLVQYENTADDYKYLGQLYVQKGDIPDAITAYQKAEQIDPSLKTDVDAYVKQLQNQ